jgi:phage host-nuclease inhibitor protein Gam
MEHDFALYYLGEYQNNRGFRHSTFGLIPKGLYSGPARLSDSRGMAEIQSPLSPIQSRDEAEASMALVTALRIQLDAEQAQQNIELQIPRKRDPKILDLRNKIAAQSARLGEWAQKDRKSWGETKSIELRQGILGFKIGNQSIGLLRGWTWEMALAKLRKAKTFLVYVRTKHEVDRLKLLADSRAEKLKPAALARFGMEIYRSESFYVEPKIEQTPS